MTGLSFLVALLATTVPSKLPVVDIGQCDPVEGARPFRWTKEKKVQVRARIKHMCRKELKASRVVCAFMDAIVVRESYGGIASVRHTKGEKERGLGAMGQSLRWHRDKWPGQDEDPMFCTPEVNAVVAHDIMWRAVTRYRATSVVELQAVYSGRTYCDSYLKPNGREKRVCFALPLRPSLHKHLCSAMERRGFSCMAPITLKDLGSWVPMRERRDFVSGVVKKWN